MKKWHWILIIIVVASLARVLFYFNNPGYYWMGDSVSYYLTGVNILRTGVIVDHWRTPVYPLVLMLPFTLTRAGISATMPTVFLLQFVAIRIAQNAGGVLTVVILFLLLTELGIPDAWAGIYCLCMAFNRILLVFESDLLTEAFSTLWLVTVTYFSVLLFKRFRKGIFIGLSVLFVIGVFLRPSFILIPAGILIILCWYHRKKTVIVASIISLILYGLTLFLYTQGNIRYFNYNGISRISDVNLLGKILIEHLPITNVRDIGGMKQIISSYIKSYKDVLDPWQVYVVHPQLYDKQNAMPMHTFVQRVLFANFGTYIWRSSLDIPSALVDVSPTVTNLTTLQQFDTLFRTFERIYLYGQFANLIVIFAIPVIFYRLLKKKTFRSAWLLLFSFLVAYHIFIGVYLGYDDYGRHLVVTQPIIYFFSLYCWVYLFKKISLWLNTD